jgi:opacity protein-like surface antigen
MKSIRTIVLSASLLVLGTPAFAQWTGCGLGAGGSMLFLNADAGGPVGMSSTGEKAGLTLNCDYRMGAFVVGGEANYDWAFGRINDLGAKDELSLLGRLGVLTNKDNLLYVVAGWGQADVQFLGGSNMKVNSWKIGLGDEFRIPNSPIYLDMRALYSKYDEGDVCKGPCPGVNIDSLEAGIRLKLKFGPGMFGQGGPMFTSEDYPAAGAGSDPKLSAPKKN